MIGIYKEYWEGIPLLVVVDSEKENKALPVLTYMHGFTSAKENNLPIAFLLAEKGYRVILPDCMLHGERAKDLNNFERESYFFDIIMQNIKDISSIREELLRRDLIEENRFGLAGTSMGGITTAAALTQYPWIKASAILMGSPKITEYAHQLVKKMKQVLRELPFTEEEIENVYKSLEKVDLSKQIEQLNGRPLFFWHGEDDSVVPFDHAYNFYEQAVHHYKNPENIRFLREVGRDHKVSRFAIQETVNWFELQL